MILTSSKLYSICEIYRKYLKIINTTYLGAFPGSFFLFPFQNSAYFSHFLFWAFWWDFSVAGSSNFICRWGCNLRYSLLFISTLFLHSVNSLENIWLTMTCSWYLKLRCMTFWQTSSTRLQSKNCEIIGLGSESKGIIVSVSPANLHIHLVKRIRQV